MRGDDARGVISIRRTEVRPFTDRQVNVLKTFADQAVIAIENTRLFEAEQASKRELQASLEYQTATSEVLNVISRSPAELQPVLNTIVETAGRLCKADHAHVFRLEDGKYRLVAHNQTEHHIIEYLSTNPIGLDQLGSVTARAARACKTVHVPDSMQDPEYGHGPLTFSNDRTVLSVPLLREGVALGVLTVGRQTLGPFTSKEIELVESFADQAVIAIENTRLFEEVQARTRELTQSLERQTATSEVLSVISSSPGELEPVFQAILENAARICEAGFGVLFTYENGQIQPLALRGVPEALAKFVRERGATKPRPGSALERLVRTKATIHVEDYANEDDSSNPAVTLGGARAYLAVPMLKEQELIGLIVMYRQEVRPFTDKQIELVTNFARQAVIAIENTRLLNELRESLQQQTATADVLKVISRSPTHLQPVLDAIISTASRLCQSECAYLFTLQDGKFVLVAYDSAIDSEFLEYLKKNPIDPEQRGSITARAAREGRTIHISDTFADPEYGSGPITAAKRRTILSVPLLREGATVGVISLDRKEVKPFTEKQIDLVKTFADQAVIAIENTRLFEEVQARTRELTDALEQQTATSEVLKIISSSPGDLQPVFNAMLENATRMCDAYFGILYRFANGAFQAVTLRGAPPAFAEFQQRGPIQPGPASGLGRILSTRHPVHITDTMAEQRYFDGDPYAVTAAKLSGSRTIVFVPMLKDDEVVGAIAIYRKEVNPFTNKQIELVSSFAKQAVIAIENTRLLNELRESLQQQTATADVLKVISRATFDLPRVLDTLVESAATLCDSYDTAILQSDGDVLRIVSRRGHHIPAIGQGGTLPLTRGGTPGRAVLDRRTVHVADLQSETEEYPEGSAIARRLGHHTILAVPLIGAGEAVGAITLRRSEVRPFTDRQIDLLQTFADQAVIAIENARLFEEVQARTRELAKTVEDLEIASQHKNQFAANMSHELRTPLAAILGMPNSSRKASTSRRGRSLSTHSPASARTAGTF
jgi:GAF domain-containing protein